MKRHRGFVRVLLLAFALGLGLTACDGSNVFRPCDPDGDTPHKPCTEQTT